MKACEINLESVAFVYTPEEVQQVADAIALAILLSSGVIWDSSK